MILVLYCTVLYAKQLIKFGKHTNIIDNSRIHIYTNDVWLEDINPNILKTGAGILRKIALELYSLEDDSELRAIFELVGGIETGINCFSLFNG